MKKSRLIFKSTIYGLLSLFILLVCLLAFLVATTPGIYTVVKLVNMQLPGELSVKKPHGSLIGKFSFKKLSYVDKNKEIIFKNPEINLNLFALVKKQELLLDSFKADELIIILIKSEEKAVEEPETIFELPELPVDITIKSLYIKEAKFKLEETVRVFKNIKMESALTGENWDFKTISAEHQGIKITATSALTPHYPYKLDSTIHFTTIAKEPINLEGKLAISGNIHEYNWQGHFTQPAEVNLTGSLKDGSVFKTIAKWQNYSWSIDKKTDLKTKRGRVEIEGVLSDFHVDLNTKITSPVPATWRLKANRQEGKVEVNSVLNIDDGYLKTQFKIDSQDKPKIQGTLSSKNLNLSDYSSKFGDIDLQGKFSGDSFDSLNVTASSRIQYLEHLLTASLEYMGKQFKIEAQLGKNSFQLQGTDAYQWKVYANLPQPELVNPSLAGLNTSIAINGKVEGPQDGSFQLTVNEGHYQLPDQLSENKQISALYFNGGTINAELTKQGLLAEGNIAIDPQKTLRISLKMPEFSLKKGFHKQQQINSELKLSIDSLAFLNNLSPDIEDAQGQLNVNLNTTGTFENPMTTGQIQLTQGQLSLPRLGIKINPAEMQLETKDGKWQLQGKLYSNQKPLMLSGSGSFYPEPAGEITISGENVPMVNTNEYKVNVTPDLKMNVSLQKLAVTGTLTIPEATISPQTFTESTTVSDDVVFASEKPSEAEQNITADINVIMGKDVKLDVKGLKGNIDGSIQLKQDINRPLIASGNLSISQGIYKAYGQELIIEQGQLFFTGGLISNPGIHIRAVRRFSNANAQFSGSNNLFDFNPSNIQRTNFANNITVGIEVEGRLTSPKVKLFSNPSNIPQADILSMLLIGRPANQASQSGGQVLLSAVSALELDSGTQGTQLLSQLKDNLPFDFNVESVSSYNQETNMVSESNAFVVGKSLSDRLHLSYNIGLMQNDSNVLTLKYLLNKFFSIQVTAGDNGSGIDFLYTRQSDSPIPIQFKGK